MEQKEYKSINKPVRKKDAMQLLLGRPVYTDDITPGNALVVPTPTLLSRKSTLPQP